MGTTEGKRSARRYLVRWEDIFCSTETASLDSCRRNVGHREGELRSKRDRGSRSYYTEGISCSKRTRAAAVEIDCSRRAQRDGCHVAPGVGVLGIVKGCEGSTVVCDRCRSRYCWEGLCKGCRGCCPRYGKSWKPCARSVLELCTIGKSSIKIEWKTDPSARG